MKVLIECEKGMKYKYELNQEGDEFLIKRNLKKGWLANYGFVLDTLQDDGDELDVYVLGEKLQQGEIAEVIPDSLIYCIDNGRIDNKLICLTERIRFKKYKIKKIAKYIKKYKKETTPTRITWNKDNIRYELAKCRALKNLFKGKD